MSHEPDTRWLQRFQNFEKAFLQLDDVVRKEKFTELERAGLIQFFEFSFELAWKTLKDYLDYKAVPVRFPREVIKESFKYELITDGDIWMDMLDKRNLLAHTYDEEKAALAKELIIHKFFPALHQVYQQLKSKK